MSDVGERTWQFWLLSVWCGISLNQRSIGSLLSARWLHPLYMAGALHNDSGRSQGAVQWGQIELTSQLKLLQVEQDDFCVSILQARQQDGCLHACPISRDVQTYNPSGGDLAAELVTAGFPCQAHGSLILDSMPGGACFSFSWFELTPVRGFQWRAASRACVIEDHDWWINPSGYLTNCLPRSRLRLDAESLETAQVRSRFWSFLYLNHF